MTADTTPRWAIGPCTAYLDSDDTVELEEWIIFEEYGNVSVEVPISTESQLDETGGQYGPKDAYIGDYDGVLRKIEMSGTIAANTAEELSEATRFISMMESLQQGEQYDYGPYWLIQANINAWPCDWRYAGSGWVKGVVPESLPPSWTYARVGLCLPVMFSKFSHQQKLGERSVDWSASLTVGVA